MYFWYTKVELETDSNCPWKAEARRILLRPTWTLWLYAVCLAAVWLAIYFGGDRWWLPTVMMFGPKWVYGLPLPVLVVWTAIARAGRRPWLLLAASGGLVLFPIAGFCLPWRALAVTQSSELCVLTCNTGRERCNPAQLAAVIAEARPDVVCLQECTLDVQAVFGDDWNVRQAGGLVVAARGEATSLDVLTRDLPDRWPRAICQVVRVRHAGRSFHVATLHLFSPRYGLAEVASSQTILAPWRRDTLARQTEYRRAESQQVSRWLKKLDGPLLIAGDFNTPISSTIYRESWGSYRNAFSDAGFGFGHTVQIEEGGYQFTARIDHILASDHWRCSECWVGPDVGSDHRPVIARLTSNSY